METLLSQYPGLTHILEFTVLTLDYAWCFTGLYLIKQSTLNHSKIYLLSRFGTLRERNYFLKFFS